MGEMGREEREERVGGGGEGGWGEERGWGEREEGGRRIERRRGEESE